MEVLKTLAASVLILSVASCEMISPVDFAQGVANVGINPLLVQSVEVKGLLDGLGVDDLLGFVGGGGKVWIITSKGYYGYDAQTLERKVAIEFSSPITEVASRFDNAIWNYAAAGSGEVLWTRVTAPSGAGYSTELLTLNPAAGAAALTHANGDGVHNLPLGNKGGTAWQAQVNAAVPNLQFNDVSGGGLTGPVNSITNLTLAQLRTSPGALFARSDAAATKLSDRHFRVALQVWPVSGWGVLSAPNVVNTDVTLPSAFTEVSWAGASSYTFKVLKAGGRTFFVPTFGANSGNNTTTSIVVIDDTSGSTLASQYVDDWVDVAVDSGDSWFQLGPQTWNNGLTSMPLRKYQW